MIMHVCMIMYVCMISGYVSMYVRMYMNIPPGPSTTDSRTMYRLLKQCATWFLLKNLSKIYLKPRKTYANSWTSTLKLFENLQMLSGTYSKSQLGYLESLKACFRKFRMAKIYETYPWSQFLKSTKIYIPPS